MSNLPPLPDGFVLVPETAQQTTMPALPPGFQRMPDEPRGDSGSFIDNTVRSVGRGVLGIGSYLDEMDAATNATLAPLIDPLLPDSYQKLPGATWGERYDQALGIQRGKDKQFDEEHPYVSTGAKLAGGVGSAVGVLRAAPAVGNVVLGNGGVGMGAKAGASLLASGATGLVQGFGNGEGGLNERFKEAGKEGVIGSAVGVAAPFAGAAIGKGLNYASDLIASRGSEVGRAAQDRITRALADEGLTLDEAAQRARQMGPDAMLADTSTGLRYEAEQIAHTDRAGRSQVINSISDRAKAASGRITSAYDDILGPRPNVHDTLEGMLTQRSAASQPLYEKALSRKVAWDNRLQAFLDDPITQSGLARGVKIQRLESLADDVPFNPQDYAIVDFNAAGDPIIGGVPNMRTLNVVKKGLDAIVDDNRNEFGRLTEMGRAVDKVRSSFLSKLDSINPDYAAARQEWGGRSEALKAFQKGQELFQSKTHPDFLAADVAKMSKADKDAMQLGVRSAVDQAMGSVRNGSLKGRQLLDADWNERKILQVLGEDDGRALINSLQGEQAMAETAGQILSGPATARRTDSYYRADAPTINRVPSGAVHAGFTVAQKGLDALTVASRDKVSRQVGSVLTATGEARERIVQELLAQDARRNEAALANPKYRAIVDAMLKGGGLAYAPNALR